MIAQRPQLTLAFGPDRELVWDQGESVRYLVASVSANGTVLNDGARVPINLALCVDVSGSMSGEKLDAARATAAAVVDALTAEDRLSLVAFADDAELLLDVRKMDARGRSAAKSAINRLETRGSTNLFDGWNLAAGRVAVAMEGEPRASHRVLMLTDGQANIGISDAQTLARFTADAQRNGILSSAVGIGDDYDEALLAAMVEAGGGRLHDATNATEIHEVVLGELLEGRASLVERAELRVSLPDGVERAEVVGPWAVTRRGGELAVSLGGLRPEQVKHVVVRVFCGAGAVGDSLEIVAKLSAHLPDGTAEITADAQSATLTFADGDTNGAQSRDSARSLMALAAWQGVAMREALALNRAGRFVEARSYLRREITYVRRYARGLDGVRGLLRELDLLERQVAGRMNGRVVKEVMLMQSKNLRGESDLRSRPVRGVGDWLQD
jgi:Ca-activated chloride channel family protein